MDQPSSDVKKRDLGLVGAIVMLSQVISNVQATRNLSGEMEKLKSEFKQVRNEQSKYFVKKKEFKLVIGKLDALNNKLATIQRQIKNIGELALEEEKYIDPAVFKVSECR